MTHEVFIDWDIDYKGWRRIAYRRPTKKYVAKRSKAWVLGRVERWRKLTESPVNIRLAFRRSSGGRVHVALHFEADLVRWPVPDADAFLLRYILLDDPERLWRDLVRHSEGDRINRLFDAKFKDGKIRKAGPWHRW